jgi:hypothetical protein
LIPTEQGKVEVERLDISPAVLMSSSLPQLSYEVITGIHCTHKPKPGLMRIQLVMHQASGFTEVQDGSVVIRSSYMPLSTFPNPPATVCFD